MEKNDFLIPLNGLASGKTVYRWTAGREFFDGFGNSDILDASLEIAAEVEKSGQYIGVDCSIKGTLTVECDRCLGELDLPVDVSERLSVKFGSDDSDAQVLDEEGRENAQVLDEEGREIVFVPADDTDLDMRQIVYDYACLAMPMQKVHADGECDPEVVSRLGAGSRSGDGESPDAEENPFSALGSIFRS